MLRLGLLASGHAAAAAAGGGDDDEDDAASGSGMLLLWRSAMSLRVAQASAASWTAARRAHGGKVHKQSRGGILRRGGKCGN